MGPVRQSSLPGFNIAAKKLEGMVTFGAVDISKYRDVTPRFQINTLPSYRIFHSHGVAHYLNLYRNESAFIKASKAYLPNYSETPDASWISNGESAAILFVDSGEIPIYWLSIGCNFHDSNDSNDSRIHIGFTNETSAFKQFHIARNETVLLSKNGSTKQIPGNVPFKELLTSIRSYFKEEEQEKEL
ncbi:Thioredoxin family protein [Histomonas meleagridis]|uniref:Thioredoxin family protein n=1 Tax=Histomonas meleagridis TaxID=135588 RepID=UPI0035594E7C|nr:Thioredoxin family protein [Histomonas meleagridis]KAH0799095.1 Thioredoxin family protein [Histomonas meleagridis]